jgi:PAS domain S-box-containing protein
MIPNASVKVLIIDTIETEFLKVKQLIHLIPNGNFKIDWCNNLQQGLNKICEFSHDLYLIDFFDMDEESIKTIVKSKSCNPDVPIIIINDIESQKVDFKSLGLVNSECFNKNELTTNLLSRSIGYGMDRYYTLQDLRNSEHKYKSIFEQTKDAIFLMDKKFQIFEVNEAMVKLFGFTMLEFKGKLITDLMVKKNQVEEFKQFSLAKNQSVKFKADFKQNKGLNSFFGEVSVVPIHQTGDGNYFQGIIDDITNIKKAERSLLMIEKMAAANRMARTLAHEIRNPLTNINLSLDHLRHQNIEQAQQHFFDIIARNSKRINDILSELLASSTPIKPTLLPNNLQDIVDESLAVALDRIMLKKIKLQIKYSDEPIEILADFDQLKIAFLNIIINGIEAMHENIGKLNISIETGIKTCSVKISDNGSGIPKDHLSHLFEPYFTAKRNGMGLGLAASLNILKSHHADIDVDSEIDKGTTFIIGFPLNHKT